MRFVYGVFFFSFLAFLGFISGTSSASLSNHDHDAPFQGEKTYTMRVLSSDDNGAIHSYKKQGGHGKGAATGGGSSNINQTPATPKKNHAPSIVQPSFLATSFLACLTLAFIMLQHHQL